MPISSDHHLRGVVLHRLDQDVVLLVRRGDLHAPREPDARVRDVAVAANLVAGVHDDDAAEGRLGEVPGDLADRGRLSHPGAPEEQHGGARVDEVADEIRAAGDGSADATGEPDDAPRAVANDGDAMQGAVDPRAVIPPDLPDVLQRALDVRVIQDVLG